MDWKTPRSPISQGFEELMVLALPCAGSTFVLELCYVRESWIAIVGATLSELWFVVGISCWNLHPVDT
jgi:hypothetical protein